MALRRASHRIVSQHDTPHCQPARHAALPADTARRTPAQVPVFAHPPHPSAVAAVLASMSERHGVISRIEARRLGLDARREQRAITNGIMQRSIGGVLLASGAPDTWWQRAAIATCLPGATAVCHGTAARLHGMTGFGRYAPIEVLCAKGTWPDAPVGTTTFFTRIDPSPDIVVIEAVPTLSLPAMLCLLAARFDQRTTDAVLDEALGRDLDPREIHEVAWRWRQRGRRGPQVILAALARRCGDRAG